MHCVFLLAAAAALLSTSTTALPQLHVFEDGHFHGYQQDFNANPVDCGKLSQHTSISLS